MPPIKRRPPIPALRPDMLRDSTRKISDRNAKRAGNIAIAEAEAEAHRMDTSRERDDMSAEQLNIQNQLFDLMRADAQVVAQHISSAGVTPTPGRRNCHEIDRPGGPISVWPVRVRRVFDEKASKSGKPVYEKTGVAIAEDTGELVFFKDGNVSQDDRLVSPYEPSDTRHDPRHGVRRQPEAEDVVPLRSVDPNLPVDRQLPLLQWRIQLQQLAGHVISDSPYTPPWELKP